jgi:uncharacterized protein YggE
MERGLIVGRRYLPLALLLLVTACSSSGTAGVPRSSQNAATGVVGHGQAKQKVRASFAFVIVAPGITNGTGGFSITDSTGEVTLQQRAQIRARMHAVGVASSSVHFDSQPLSLGSLTAATVRVEVPVSRLPDLASKVANAITDVIGTQTTSGLRFAVADCSAALSTARPAAMADARRHATALARAAHVTLGELRAVDEGSGNSIDPAYLSAVGAGEPCGRSSADASTGLGRYGDGIGLLPLDAKPEVELTFSVAATYALDTPAGRTMTAVGTGEIEGSADRADILVSSSIDGSFSNDEGLVGGPRKLTAEERDRIVAGVRGFGVPASDIEVETQGGDVLSYVRVHLDVTRFRASATKIVDAVKRVTGAQVQAGVFFTASNCDALVARAREKAAADADKRIARLARAAELRVGEIVNLDEPSSGLQIGPQLDSCPPDFSSLDSGGALLSVVSGGYGGLGGLSLQPLDADAKVTERVSVSETRAITG